MDATILPTRFRFRKSQRRTKAFRFGRFAALAAPLVLPILSPSGLRDYMVKGKIAIEPDEAASLGAPITQMFADELGWRELEAEVARVYRALPQTERSRTAIFAANYGEAAAIDVFGVADSLPRATSGEDQYYLWGHYKSRQSAYSAL